MTAWRGRLTEPLPPDRARAIRVQVALIPVYVWLLVAWSSYAVDMRPAGRLDGSGHIKGHDFSHFYVLGQIALEHRAGELYDFSAQAARTERLVPGLDLRFLPVHAPQVALFFAPLAMLPYERALVAWLALSATLYACCAAVWWSAFSQLRTRAWLVAVLCVGAPAFHSLVASGQTSAFALAWLTLAFFALKAARPWLAGFALGMLVYKPSLGLVLPVILVASRQWRVIAGALLSATAQFGIAAAYFGTSALAEYASNWQVVGGSIGMLEARPWLMHSLWSFFSLAIPWPAPAGVAYAVAALVMMVLAVRAWMSAAPLDARYAVLLLATVLVSPHVYAYELVVLTPALMFALSRAIDGGRHAWSLWAVMAAVYYLPALDGLTRLTHVQWSVPAMIALAFLLAREPGFSIAAPGVGAVA